MGTIGQPGNGWADIFKDRHLINVIYLAVFIIFIIGTYIKIDNTLVDKFAKRETVEVLEKKQRESETAIKTISMNLQRIVWKEGLEWLEAR